MAHSIGTRIYWTVFGAYLLSLFTIVGLVLASYDDLERSILALELKAEREFFLEKADQNAPLVWNTSQITAFYVPTDLIGKHAPPDLFLEFPFPFSGEVEVGAKTFLMTLGEAKGGRLYLAMDISLFEAREVMFEQLLALASAGAIALGLALSRFSAKRLAAPLQRLATTIRSTPVSQRMPRLILDFKDEELLAIGAGFNDFLDELEGFVAREQSLLSMASHELRTPIAVIGGAAEILDHRGQLSADDQRTLKRIQLATAEMTANMEALLKISRKQGSADEAQCIDMASVLRDVLGDLASTTRGADRVSLEITGSSSVMADPVLVKMLVRNLLHNAVQHTHGSVLVRLDAESVAVFDSGGGLPEQAQWMLREGVLSSRDSGSWSGLGLYIVTLICQRLEWRLDVESTSEGTVVRLRYGAH